MTPEDLNRHNFLDNEVEMGAVGTPGERLEHYANARIDALVERDWPLYNQIGKRITELVLDRKQQLPHPEERTKGRL